MRNYKKVSECPPKFEKAINWLNLLPNDLTEFLEKLSKMQEQKVSEDKIRKFYLKYVRKLDSELQKYLLGREGDVWFYGEMILHELNRDLQVIHLLVMYARQERIAKQRKKDWENSERKVYLVINGERQEPNFNPKWMPSYIDINTQLFYQFINFDGSKGLFTRPMVNEEGFVELAHTGLSEAFQTERIKVDQIRICPICHNIFWLKDKKHKTCGKQKCVDDLQNLKKKEKREKQKAAKDVAEELKRKQRQERLNQDFSKKWSKNNGTL